MKNPMQLSRRKVIEALRSYTTHDQLAVMLLLPTADLRGRLAYYLAPDAEKRDGRAPTVRGYEPPTRMLRIVVERGLLQKKRKGILG